jgi:protein SCO1/2
MRSSLAAFLKLSFLSLSLFGLITSSACESTPPEASASAKRYELKGKVVSADKSNHQVTIAHEPIEGYMEAMTMPFALADDWVYSELKPGAQIQATLIVDGGRSWLENPVVTTVVNPNLAKTEESVAEPGAGPSIGTEAPDFTLVNQDGKKISLKQYRGRALLLTFIYTRCPLPDYCPLMSQNFSQISTQLIQNPALKDKVHLLSISVDPTFDKPKVLRAYGEKYVVGSKVEEFKHWEFASGSAEQVKKTAQFFGLEYWPERDQIIHGLRTAIIGPDGKVVKVYRGNEWKPEQVVKELESMGL